ncbi:MAG: hypothetical protein EHM91_06885 [Planctomycetota bacterium]|nr:MAG: hypothetical protein EHM91_06885 [Planctomycetota bacterium]
MSELPDGIDPEIFEDLHTALAGLSLCHVINRPADLWEILQLVKSDRAMVRGEIYRYDGLREAYRAAGIARTIVQKLDGIRERTGTIIKGLREFLKSVPGVPSSSDTIEFVIAFITISPKGRDAVARWIADPGGQKEEASTKVKAISNIVESYQRTLREFRPAPPPPSSPLDKESRPQLQPRFQARDVPLEGPLIPASAPAAAPAPAPKPAVPAPKPEPKPVEVAVPVPALESVRPLPPAVAVAPPSPVSLILPRGVNPEVLEDVRRVDQCRKIFEETHQEIEVWEVFCLVMLDGEGTRGLLEQTLQNKEKADARAFMDGAMALFDRLIKLRAQHGKFVRELRGYLGQLPVGSFGKETMEMALGFIVASGRGRDRAQLWLQEPSRYKQEAAGRLEDVISRTMNYQTALRMVQ